MVQSQRGKEVREVYKLLHSRKMIHILVLALFTLALGRGIHSEVCLDGSFCSDNSTCCQLHGNAYGCCQMENAVCCADRKNCCPQNHRCKGGFCFSLGSFNMILTTAINKLDEMYCDDSGYVCPDDSTCCQGPKDGSFGCCLMENAKCCEDQYACCPGGMTCDLELRQCSNSSHILPLYNLKKTRAQTWSFSKFAALERPSHVVCPTSESQCPSNHTCCQFPFNDWDCCPFSNAVCCPDGEHCCPSGTHCDFTSQSCRRKGVSMDSVLKFPAKSLIENTVCPDKSACSSSSTCCKLKGKNYGCCPHPNAVCCTDGSHCCREGFLCDIVKKRCVAAKKSLS